MEKFRTCSRCDVTRYCSKDCQKKHWKEGHKKECVAKEEKKKEQEKRLNELLGLLRARSYTKYYQLSEEIIKMPQVKRSRNDADG